VVLLEGIDESSCQRCGLHTIEVKSCHAVGRNGSLCWNSRLWWGEVESGIGNEGGVPMAILLLFSTLSTVSEIAVGGQAIGISPAAIRRCRRSSQSFRRSIS
jgi:hypothetical protein